MNEQDVSARTGTGDGAPAGARAGTVHATASPPYVVIEGAADADHAKAEDEAPPPARPDAPPFNPAGWMHQRIVNQIVEFEKNLGPDHELGGRFVEGPHSEALHITNVASWAPDMILFIGEYPDGRRFELIQHYSQVSVLLVAVPRRTDQPRRIGFDLMEAVKDQVHPWGDPIS